MEKKTSVRKRIMAALTVLVGAMCFAYGLYLFTWRDTQYQTYNAGLAAYQNGDVQTAIKFFDQSLGVYRTRQNESWTERFVYPKPNKELAAQAAFHKAKALLRAKQVKPAVESFRESLELNSGNLYQGRGLSAREIQEAAENAYVVKYDLYLLFKNNPEQAQQQGKGKGKPGDKKGDGKPVPGNDPSTMPGKGNRDDI
jgi:tetratricopeptide (TPR) repeat protein